ncbi:DUF485 domain-containing protein [Streptomyces sp. LX-29]|nr:DUF485 domain-containing protein [Streptomyces sp. LX-29]WFB11527.1 DUF485 domain-containing protein [Streptomyces sp. LX-29]
MFPVCPSLGTRRRAAGPRRVRVENAHDVPGPHDPPGGDGAEEADDARAAAYRQVHRSAAFREVRGRYRRFVLPASLAFLVWYLAYVITATTAPGLMARPVVGACNVGLLAGIAQFATTFLLTWAYARHARLRRDGPALELRWVTQELTGTLGGAAPEGAAETARGERGRG